MFNSPEDQMSSASLELTIHTQSTKYLGDIQRTLDVSRYK
jgi:hypothetical protein